MTANRTMAAPEGVKPPLACPACRNAPLRPSADGGLDCTACGARYQTDQGIADFRHTAAGGAPPPEPDAGASSDTAILEPLLGALVRRLRALRRVRGCLRLLDVGMTLATQDGFTEPARDLDTILDLYVAVTPGVSGPLPIAMRNPRAAILLAYSGHLPLEGGSFDLIADLTSLLHLPDPRPVLDEIRRVIADDGLYLVRLRNRRAWFDRIGGGSDRRGPQWTPGDFRTLLTRHGFRIVESRGLRYAPVAVLRRKAGPGVRRLLGALSGAIDALGNMIDRDAGGDFVILCRPSA